jgi:CubicO group peptidase (beta-lactamase class C family)
VLTEEKKFSPRSDTKGHEEKISLSFFALLRMALWKKIQDSVSIPTNSGDTTMKSSGGARLVIAAMLTLFSAAVAFAQSAPLQGFDDYVNRALKEWEAPGVAIAIVRDDKIIFAKGYGVRKFGEPMPVNERTMFAIGSSSKAFTAAAIALLVDDGKVKWNDPVTKHLPGFELYDSYAAQQMTLRDLLCHNSGLERGDLMWYGSSFSRDEILRRVRFLKPSWSFRGNFGYQNIMYLAAGQVVQAVSGKTWDDFIRQRIFTPLGMKESNTSVNDLKAMNNVATPHAKHEDKVIPIAWRNIDNIAPAGSINSNVTEMAEWVRLQLGEGNYQGSRLISSGALKEMHQSQMIMRAEPPWTWVAQEAHFMAYGLGWFLHDYRGRKIVEHGGNIDGMSALVSLVPEEKLGLVILTNMNGTMLPAALQYRIIDALLNQPEKDWSATLLKTIKAFEAQGKEAEKKQLEARVKDTRPSLALDKYAGSYTDEMYGEATVALENGKLIARYGQAFTGELEHWHFDTFQVKWKDIAILGKGLVTFTLNAQGKVDLMKLENFADFKRAPDKAPAAAAVAVSESELRKFIGKYATDSPPVEISIEVVGGKLKAVVPGQPLHSLIPVTPTRFQIEGAPAGYFISFELTGNVVKSLKLEQGDAPALTLTPKRTA